MIHLGGGALSCFRPSRIFGAPYGVSKAFRHY